MPRISFAAVLLVALAATSSMAFAAEVNDSVEAGTRYSAASICGNYGAIATYGANVARALGWEKADGHGNLTGRATVNQPGPNDTRSLTTIGISGSYSVKPDGTGKMILSIALPNGATANVTEDFVITRSKVVDRVPIATEIQDTQEQPSAVIDDSGLVIHSYTLRGTPKTCGSDQ